MARGSSDDPQVWLGAALPDLQREAGVALGESSRWSSAVQRGILCHRDADTVFHDLAVFHRQSLELNTSLQARGLPRGAARAIGHAGWELLFDGALVGDAALVDAYLMAMSVEVAVAAPGLAAAHAAQWRAALGRRVARGAPWFYADPAAVAGLLSRILGSRRLLAFDPSLVPTVAAVLADAQPAITASVDEVFAGVHSATGH